MYALYSYDCYENEEVVITKKKICGKMENRNKLTTVMSCYHETRHDLQHSNLSKMYVIFKTRLTLPLLTVNHM